MLPAQGERRERQGQPGGPQESCQAIVHLQFPCHHLPLWRYCRLHLQEREPPSLCVPVLWKPTEPTQAGMERVFWAGYSFGAPLMAPAALPSREKLIFWASTGLSTKAG